MNSCESGKFADFNWDDEVVKETCVIHNLKNESRYFMENIDPFINLLMIFVLACIIGYYVIWGVTSALHSPLMAVTNAISSVIIVGALIAAGPEDINFSSLMGFFAIILASINIFGGFVVSHRMLSMFKKKDKKKDKK